MTDLTGRRLEYRDTGMVVRVVKHEGNRALIARRGEQAHWADASMVGLALDAGILVDITDARVCPACGGTMNREPECRIEWRAERVINGYHDRHNTERKVAVKPVWLCAACEHAEVER